MEETCKTTNLPYIFESLWEKNIYIYSIFLIDIRVFNVYLRDRLFVFPQQKIKCFATKNSFLLSSRTVAVSFLNSTNRERDFFFLPEVLVEDLDIHYVSNKPFPSSVLCDNYVFLIIINYPYAHIPMIELQSLHQHDLFFKLLLFFFFYSFFFLSQSWIEI